MFNPQFGATSPSIPLNKEDVINKLVAVKQSIQLLRYDIQFGDVLGETSINSRMTFLRNEIDEINRLLYGSTAVHPPTPFPQIPTSRLLSKESDCVGGVTTPTKIPSSIEQIKNKTSKTTPTKQRSKILTIDGDQERRTVKKKSSNCSELTHQQQITYSNIVKSLLNTKKFKKTLNGWVQTSNFSTLFDSSTTDNDGGILRQKLLKKKELFFINFDGVGNVFGGYLSKEIQTINGWIRDPKSFVFSYYRNGELVKKKYLHRDGGSSFKLCSKGDSLYVFGKKKHDIKVAKLLQQSSSCTPTSYGSPKLIKPLAEDSQNPFALIRIVVLQLKK
ncbi:TLDc domain-containing protein [Entamoeba marina]